MTLFSEGMTTACLFDCGDGVTHVVPVNETIVDRHNMKRMNLAGRSVTEYLIKLLKLKGYPFNSSADFETVREIKEKYCFVSHDLSID
jgi:actin-related protein 2